MKLFHRLLSSRSATPKFFAGTAIVTFVAILGLSTVPSEQSAEADIRIEPLERVVPITDSFDVSVVVESNVPVNVFAGELRFNEDVLTVESIDYNTSIADLWTEEPWYSNGDGTITFSGGTTQAGGFSGTASLLRVTFRAAQTGKGAISLHGQRILLHDGLGTDASLADSKEALFTVSAVENIPETDSSGTTASYEVVSEPPTTDLNGDGEQSIADISIFMLNLTGNNPRYDFNLDGKVGIRDLNILLGL